MAEKGFGLTPLDIMSASSLHRESTDSLIISVSFVCPGH